MSTYPTAPAQGHTSTGAAPERPGTLKAAVIIAVVAGLAAIGNAVVILTGGAKLIVDLAMKDLGDVTAGLGDLGVDTSSVMNAAAQGAVEIFQTRAYIALVGGGGLLVFGLAMINAATWARILVTICAVLAMGISGIIGFDGGNGLMQGLGWTSILGGILAIIFAWLSPNGRYAKARKTA